MFELPIRVEVNYDNDKTRAIGIAEANDDFRRATRLRKQINKIQDLEDEISIMMHD